MKYLLRYILQGFAVAIVARLYPKVNLNINEIIYIAVISSTTLCILDLTLQKILVTSNKADLARLLSQHLSHFLLTENNLSELALQLNDLIQKTVPRENTVLLGGQGQTQKQVSGNCTFSCMMTLALQLKTDYKKEI